MLTRITDTSTMPMLCYAVLCCAVLCCADTNSNAKANTNASTETNAQANTDVMLCDATLYYITINIVVTATVAARVIVMMYSMLSLVLI